MKLIEQDNKVYLLSEDGTYTVYQQIKIKKVTGQAKSAEGLSKETNSSFIDEIAYLVDAQMLLINMNGNVYAYANVPTYVYADMLEADSYGKFYNAEIKGKYYSVKIDL